MITRETEGRKGRGKEGRKTHDPQRVNTVCLRGGRGSGQRLKVAREKGFAGYRGHHYDDLFLIPLNKVQCVCMCVCVSLCLCLAGCIY